MKKILIGIICFMFWVPAQADKTLRFAVMDFTGDATKRWKSLSQYISTATGVPVKLIKTQSIPLAKRADKFDVILTNPVSAMIIHKKQAHNIIATMNHKTTGPTFAGMVIVHKDSGINTLKDLSGKKIGVVDLKNAAGGYLFQARELTKAGLDLKKDVKFTVVPSQKAIIHKVIKKRIDAGFIRVGMLALYKDAIDVSQVNILNKQPYQGGPLMRSTQVYSHWAVLTAKTLPAPLQAKIKAALLALKPTDAAASAGNINGFTEAADYTDVRALMQDMGYSIDTE